MVIYTNKVINNMYRTQYDVLYTYCRRIVSKWFKASMQALIPEKNIRLQAFNNDNNMYIKKTTAKQNDGQLNI